VQEAHDYSDKAGLFYGMTSQGWGQVLKFKRFETLAAAIKFAVEEMRPGNPYISIETGDGDLDRRQIRALYNESRFPLQRNGRIRARVLGSQ
jgi:hypothetical protein